LIFTTKKDKDQAQTDIDSLILNGEILTSNEHPLARISKMNTHADVISYAAMLQGYAQTYNEAMTGSPHSSQTCHVIISYDLTDETSSTPKKSWGKMISIPKDSDSQTTEVTDFYSITILERLESNNKTVKKEIMISLKQNIRLANNEILQKVEELFTTFQIFMLNTQSHTNQ